jgi:hypothetical protein
MANLMLDYVPATNAEEVQIGMPVFLESTADQPQQFGDGQRNALATYGEQKAPPFVAVLTRTKSGPAQLALILSKDILGEADSVEVSILNQSQVFTKDAKGIVTVPIDLQKMKWDQLFGAVPVFFRPVGWQDWFAVEFPYAYLSIDQLVAGMDPVSRSLPNGRSVIDPLAAAGAVDPQTYLRDLADPQGFNLDRIERSARVHGTYNLANGQKLLTATGGVWTRYRLGSPFKVVYLAKDPRVVDIEEEEGVVSGTGPHYIGATGEIILNSLGTKPLMTFYGQPAPPSDPNGRKLAWGFTHQWVGTWLRPGQAFVTRQGMYHWHLNHLEQPIAAQVLTPPEVPSEKNHFGFLREQ